MSYVAFGVFVLAVMGIPAGFVAWPVAWRFDASERVRAWARRLFVLHTVGVVSTVALAVRAEQARWPDAYLWVIPLYLVGLVSFVVGAAVTMVAVRNAKRA
jgi:hypothetical protein